MAMAVTAPRYTVDELEYFPDDGNRYELLTVEIFSPWSRVYDIDLAEVFAGIP